MKAAGVAALLGMAIRRAAYATVSAGALSHLTAKKAGGESGARRSAHREMDGSAAHRGQGVQRDSRRAERARHTGRAGGKWNATSVSKILIRRCCSVTWSS